MRVHRQLEFACPCSDAQAYGSWINSPRASSLVGDQARPVPLVETEAGTLSSGEALGLRAATCKRAQVQT